MDVGAPSLFTGRGRAIYSAGPHSRAIDSKGKGPAFLRCGVQSSGGLPYIEENVVAPDAPCLTDRPASRSRVFLIRKTEPGEKFGRAPSAVSEHEEVLSASARDPIYLAS
jgi:hypothetical protein